MQECLIALSVFIHGSEMVEVHRWLTKIERVIEFIMEVLPDVPSGADRCNKENKNKCDWVKEYVSSVEDRQS